MDTSVLPAEDIERIISYLPVKDLLSCRLVNRQFKQIATQDRIWQRHYRRKHSYPVWEPRNEQTMRRPLNFAYVCHASYLRRKRNYFETMVNETIKKRRKAQQANYNTRVRQADSLLLKYHTTKIVRDCNLDLLQSMPKNFKDIGKKKIKKN